MLTHEDRVPAQTHAGAVEPYQAQVTEQQEFETNLINLLKCYGPMCRVRLTLHPVSAGLPVTGLACDPIPPGADGVYWWWCTRKQQA